MSFMLQFPPSTFPVPTNIDRRAYADIFIGNINISQKIPRIPLAMLLHFAPNLAKYLESVTMQSGAPHNDRCLNLPNESAEIYGIQVIISRMLQLSGIASPPIIHEPNTIIGAIRILRAWRLFGIDMKGASSIHTRILAVLWLHTIKNNEVEAIWEYFEKDNPIVNAMIQNIVNNCALGEINGVEYTKIRYYARGHPSLSGRIREATAALDRKVTKEETATRSQH
ncbi:hypothetical protein AOQ84DRAFT_380920 [Glonium stellatum]|uniref:Uncharacterized protein n=1 Tax=Glonium stellatum TaxID=574774 RepID=A0A8E2ETM0_9PEZI|nr:hypothetical protein AOQ84DRAFT_380920 [Glonium stellatum]